MKGPSTYILDCLCIGQLSSYLSQCPTLKLKFTESELSECAPFAHKSFYIRNSQS